MTIEEQLKEIKPGVNYPASVTVKEKVEGKDTTVSFLLQSYYVGMYCSIGINGEHAHQCGDHNNKTFVRKLVQDIRSAIKRGASVEIGTLRPVKKDFA